MSRSSRCFDVLSISSFSRELVEEVCASADRMRELVEKDGACELLKGKLLANIFYEPSSRTASSFHAAMLRLGGGVVPIAASTSSVTKGESLEDTIRTMASYCDVIVLRHPQVGAASRAASVSSVAVLNAGDGVGEHPTQALLDLYTIRHEAKSMEGLVVTMLGDLKNGRTVHSLAKLLSMYDVKLNYVSPDPLRMPESVKASVAESGIVQVEHNELSREVLQESDVLYVTRVQKERFNSEQEYLELASAFVVTPEVLKECKSSLVLMHPLPRVQEISRECDSDPRAAYFRQMRNGMFVRMALLARACNH